MARAQAPAATFAAVVNYGAKGIPRAIVVADVNGDGKPDLLMANNSSAPISVLLGTGNGTFGTATTYGSSANGFAFDLAVADVNGDGKLDILTANPSTGTVGVLLGSGTGTFGTTTTFSTGAGGNPESLALADVNGDGKLDILTANPGNDTVGLLLGSGTGTFGTATTFSTGAGSNPRKIVVADVNTDGQLDLLTLNGGTYNVGVLLGTGTGTFGAVATYSTGGSQSQLSDIAVADVNGDGKPDLLATNYGTDEAAILLGTGRSVGTFGGGFTTVSTGTDSAPLGVTVADVNGDGKLDLLTANQGPLFRGSQGTSSVGVLLGNGNGSFGATTTLAIGNSNFLDIAAADVNSDGKPDLLTANYFNSTVSVLLNTTVYATPALTSLSPASGPVGATVTLTGQNLTGATAVSFNGTAATTFSVVNATTITATVPAGATSGNVTVTTPGGTNSGVTFTVTTNGPVPASPTFTLQAPGAASSKFAEGITVADVNKDGLLDVITATRDQNGGEVAVRLGKSAASGGGFQSPNGYGTSSGETPVNTAVADINGDGFPDILFVSDSGSGVINVLLGSASGSFTSSLFAGTGGGNPLYDVLVADVNNDGRPDVFAVSFSKVIVYTSGASASSYTSKSYPTGGNLARGLALGDVNGDGLLDIVAANNSSANVGVLLGNSAASGGGFQPVQNYAVDNTREVAVADVNGDGLADIITGFNNSVKVLLSKSAANGGGFQAAQTYAVGSDASRLTVADVNGDGLPDVITGGGVAVLVSNSAANGGGFQPAQNYGSGGGDVAVGDVNQDGRPDILAAVGRAVNVLLNTTIYAPTLTSLSATSGTVGTSVTLTGQNLTGATAVSFNGTAATTFAVVNATTLTATVPTGATTGPVTVTTPGGTSNGVAFAVAITLTTWTGTISTDWFTTGNWTQGVPTATIDATIPSAPSGGRFPALSAGTASARNLTLNNGATLNQSGGTLAIAANLTNNGTFLPTGGTVNLGTTSLSIVLGSSNIRFWNLAVGASGAQLSMPAGAAVRRLLTLNGNFATNGNQFVLESNTTMTALVVNNNSNVVNGTVTVQRAIDPSVNPSLGYRHYAAPVSNSTVGDLATSGFTPVVNPAFNTAASPNSVVPFPTVFGYDDSRLTMNNNLGSFDKGYFSPATLSDPLAVGRGYTVNLSARELVDFQGTLNNGDLILPLSSTRNTYPDGGWQLLGNPYPAPLDYARVAAADRAGLEAAIYVYTSVSQYGGFYRLYINGIGNPVLPLGQGYFTRVASGQATATMTFRNSQRLTEPNATPFQRPAADPRPLVQLELRPAAGPAVAADEFFAYAEAGATPAFDTQFDAQKLPNPSGFNLAGLAPSGEPLAADGRPAFTASTVLPLTVGVPAAGAYVLSAAALNNLPTGLDAYLADDLTGQTLKLSAGTSYAFSVSPAQAAATIAGRFRLLFRPNAPLATTPSLSAADVSIFPNPAHARFTVLLPGLGQATSVQAELLNNLGQVVRRQTAALPATGTQLTFDAAKLATGVYVLRLQAGAATLAKRVVVQ
jgi:hypothetical protein